MLEEPGVAAFLLQPATALKHLAGVDGSPGWGNLLQEVVRGREGRGGAVCDEAGGQEGPRVPGSSPLAGGGQGWGVTAAVQVRVKL